MPYPRATTRLLVSLLLLLLLSPPLGASARTPLPAKPAPLLDAAFREVIEQGVANGAYAGVAVGAIGNGRQETYYFGHRDGARGVAPDADSQFEIGAVSEVFAGLLLAQAALDGKLRLSDAIGKFLPADFPFSAAGTAAISLDALATQRSGLPMQPLNLFPRDLDDPFADYAAEDLLEFLAYRVAPPPAPAQTVPAYSVLNAGLLGHLLGRLYRAPYGEVLRARVLEPLGLAHTGIDDAPALLAGHAAGHIAPHWHYGVLSAAAGLRATLPDLVAFLQHCIAPGDGPLRSAMLLARQARAPALGRAGDARISDQAALGWNVREVDSPDGSWPLVWRASETAGFAAFLGFRSDKQKAIALLGNSASDLAELGMAWLTETTTLPEAPHGAARRGAATFEEYQGLYELASGGELVIRAGEGGLSLQLPGAWPCRLRPLDRDVFAGDDDNGVTFVRNPDTVEGLLLHRAGTHVSARRLSRHAPRIARPAGASARARLDELRGDWRIEDSELRLRVGVESDALTLQAARGLRLSLRAYAADRYADGQGAVDLAVQRDAQGRASALALDLAGTTRVARPLHAHAMMKAKP